MSLFEAYNTKRKSVFYDTGKRFIDLEQINDYLIGQGERFRSVSPMSMIELNFMWEWFSDEEYSAGFIIVDEDTLDMFCKWLSNSYIEREMNK